jgi:hypothetical protein
MRWLLVLASFLVLCCGPAWTAEQVKAEQDDQPVPYKITITEKIGDRVVGVHQQAPDNIPSPILSAEITTANGSTFDWKVEVKNSDDVRRFYVILFIGQTDKDDCIRCYIECSVEANSQQVFHAENVSVPELIKPFSFNNKTYASASMTSRKPAVPMTCEYSVFRLQVKPVILEKGIDSLITSFKSESPDLGHTVNWSFVVYNPNEHLCHFDVELVMKSDRGEEVKKPVKCDVQPKSKLTVSSDKLGVMKFQQRFKKAEGDAKVIKMWLD